MRPGSRSIYFEGHPDPLGAVRWGMAIAALTVLAACVAVTPPPGEGSSTATAPAETSQGDTSAEAPAPSDAAPAPAAPTAGQPAPFEPGDASAPVQENATPGASLQPGDAIKLVVWRGAEVSGTYQVDERGIVVFPLIGERQVTGVAPEQLRKALTADFSHYLQNPSIQITVLRRINILGEVRTPGLYPVDPTISLADALALAGGVGPNGNPNDIRLIREGRVLQQDLSQATLIGSTPIRSGDQIVVGQRSWLSRNLAIVSSLIAAAAVTTAAIIR